jgi:ribosomal protein S18 acetylase RimI-like enzyme
MSHSRPKPRPVFTLRELSPADERALEWHGGPDLRSFYQNQTRAHQAGKIHVLIAAGEYEGQKDFPIGQAAIFWQGKPTHPQIPDIQSLRVHPHFRGAGIGSRLVRACEEYSRRKGHERISLSVALDNHRARRLYERLGYVVAGPNYSDVWFYTDAKGQTVRVEETVLDMIKELNLNLLPGI